MRKQPKQVKAPAMPKGNDEGGKFVSRDLLKINPTKEQFAPMPAEPVRQQYKMAGGC
jgi:hypothetical protein